MKLLKKEPRGGAKQPAVSARGEQTRQRLLFACEQEPNAIYDRLGTAPDGITEDRAEELRDEYGRNVLSRGRKTPLYKVIAGAFLNPFTIVLLVLAGVSLFTDVILAEPGSRNPMTVIIIAVMILLSGSLRLIQETKSGNAAARLSASILTTAGVQRAEGGHIEIPMEELVVGDTIYLSAGDMVPADVRIIAAKDLFVSQSSLTGESEPVEKTAAAVSAAQPSEAACLAFLGSTVVSGSATAIVLAVGDDTLLGELAQRLNVKPPRTSFEKGVNAVSWVLIRFMLVMVPVVLFLSGFTKGDWLNALLFAISVAVGLTPEMLPMIVTTCLARGAVAMSKHKVIIKSLNAIQNLGSIDILCTDKTGTLTQDQVVLEYHLDVNGREDSRVLRHAFLNSYFQTGLKNLMDLAILDHTKALDPVDGSYSRIISTYRKVDEIPFDFERRRMSVVVADTAGKTQLITKGAIEEMLQISSFVEYDGIVAPLTAEMKRVVLSKAAELNTGGMRVLGVAQKTNPSPVGAFSVKDESDMVLIGYLAFLDPPKKTAAAAIAALHSCGVDVKVLTGDNEKVAACVCRQVGLKTDTMVLGSQLDGMSDRELSQVCERASVFAKLSPAQKARVVTLLRQNGHSVGYMGDGINDAAAMKASDVGISVDTAVDIAKESASVVLLEKDLLVLEEGILEGRRTYANMIKYIKMTASSNFGNMLSVLAASAFLPFLPMASVQLILLNMIYDFSCTLIPWDNVDAEYLKKPRQWSANSITRFMLRIGPTSSVFDLATYALMFFAICPAVCGGAYGTLSPDAKALFVSVFRTGWFVESMWTQALVVHMIRTEKVPFLQSRASRPLLCSTFCAIAVVTAIPFTPFGTALGLHALPAVYFACLIAFVLGYMLLVTAAKKTYIRRYGELL